MSETRRVRNALFYDIFGIRVAWHRVDNHTRGECVKRAYNAAAIESQVMQGARGYVVVAAINEVQLCCYERVFCANCLQSFGGHDDRTDKCAFVACYADYSLSAMDIHCPGWRDRYVGDDPSP